MNVQTEAEIQWIRKQCGKGCDSTGTGSKENTSQYEWKTGDIIDYEVLVSQTKQDVKAVNVVITDELPSCLQFLEGQYAVETSQGGENCTLTGQGENGWKAECPSLKYGETITIRFKCQASADSNGQEWENIVTATADNLINPETGETGIQKGYGRSMAEQSTA